MLRHDSSCEYTEVQPDIRCACFDRAIAAAEARGLHQGRLEGAKAALVDIARGMGGIPVYGHLLESSAAAIVAEMEAKP